MVIIPVPATSSLAPGAVEPIPTLPLLSIVILFVRPVSPPAEVWKSRRAPSKTSIVLVEAPLKTRDPEVEASPATSRRAVGAVVPIPIFPADVMYV